MSDDEGKAAGVVRAVEGLVKAVPVYEDAVQPAAKQIGQSLETVGKLINVALQPIRGLVWTFEQAFDFVGDRLAELLREVPPDQITTPSPQVAVQVFEALRYTGHDEILRELFAKLLATSMDARTARKAHPAFVDIIRNLSPDEARILRFLVVNDLQPLVDLRINIKGSEGFRVVLWNVYTLGNEAGCVHLDLASEYLGNLCRLGLLEIPAGSRLTREGAYDEVEKIARGTEAGKSAEASESRSVEIDRKVVRLTPFGRQFSAACIGDSIE